MKRPLAARIWTALPPRRRVRVADVAAGCGCSPETVMKWVRTWNLVGWVERYGLVDQCEAMRTVRWTAAPTTVNDAGITYVSHPEGGRWKICRSPDGGGPPVVTSLLTGLST